MYNAFLCYKQQGKSVTIYCMYLCVCARMCMHVCACVCVQAFVIEVYPRGFLEKMLQHARHAKIRLSNGHWTTPGCLVTLRVNSCAKQSHTALCKVTPSLGRIHPGVQVNSDEECLTLE